MYYFVAAVFGLAWCLAPIIALVVAFRARRDLVEIRERLDSLEAGMPAKQEMRAGSATLPMPATLPAPSPAAPRYSAEEPVPILAAPTGAGPKPRFVPDEAAAIPVAAGPTPVQPPAPSPKRLDSERLEQLIGGIWLQNVGSLLLLLGTFFLIVWGYAERKFGPEVLVAAGVAFGLVLAWRGDRMARTIRPLGDAILGVGLGVVYITLYVGHFNMHVLSEGMTFALLTLLSFATVEIGLRRRQAVIASFGVAGAFLPLLLASLSGPGFFLTPSALLGYLVVVNAVVFALTATRGWSGLALMTLVFTSITWAMHTRGVSWGFPVQLGVSALFVTLGMVPVVRLARSQAPARGIDLAVVSMAPLLLIIATFGYFAAAERMTAGGLLAGLALVNLVAALWIDTRRPERDLWRPLIAAAVIFLAAALERLLATEYLSLAWCVEGAALVWVGNGPRGRWIRGLGYGVSLIACMRILYFQGSYDPMAGGGIGIFNGASLRDLLCIMAILAVSDRVGRNREWMTGNERHVPGGWVVAVNVLILVWLVREAPYLARWFADLGAPAPLATHLPSVASPRRAVDSTLIAGLAWTVQSSLLVFLAHLRRAPVLRHVGYAVATIGIVPLALALCVNTYWSAGNVPVFYPAGLLTLFGVAWIVGTAAFLWSRRSTLGSAEGIAPPTWIIVANLTLLLWISREAGHVADVVGSEVRLTAPLLAFLWAAHAAALVLLASAGRIPLLRYIGYVIGALMVIPFLGALTGGQYWTQHDPPVVYPAGLLMLGCVASMMTIPAFLWVRRPSLASAERRAPEVGLVLANVLLLLWSAHEAAHVASTFAPGAGLTTPPGEATAMLTAGITSGAWMLQAGALMALGWVRGSAFVRWMGLGLVGLTLSKFVLFDLQQVDVFWRFVLALGVGAVLLLLSFVYQRKNRSEKAA